MQWSPNLPRPPAPPQRRPLPRGRRGHRCGQAAEGHTEPAAELEAHAELHTEANAEPHVELHAERPPVEAHADAEAHDEPHDDAEEEAETRADADADAAFQAYTEWVEYARQRLRQMRESRGASFDPVELRQAEAIAALEAEAIAEAEPHADEPHAVQPHAVDPHAGWRGARLSDEYRGFQTEGERRIAWTIMEDDRRARLEAAAASVSLRFATTEAERREAYRTLAAERARLRADAALARAEEALATLWELWTAE